MNPCLAGMLLLAAAAPSAAAERFVLAWPPTRYDSAELVLHRGPGTPDGPAPVSVSARGLAFDGEVPADLALRIELPVEARCLPGVDACAIVVESAAPGLRVVLQSPSTNGVPDTLARTAHDTVRAAGPSETGLTHVVLSAPNSADHAEALSFAVVVPTAAGTAIVVEGACTPRVEATLADGEVLTVSCAGAGEDLSGALVTSDAAVSVLCGNVVAPMPVQDGSGWSADLVLDAVPALEPLATGSTWLAPPLPRAPTHQGLGDLLRCAAGASLEVRIRDGRGRDELRSLAAGELLELDSADPGGDLPFRLDADGPLACWQVTKSRVHRGRGDPAALPLVPRELFTQADTVFVPDGYGEGSELIVVREPGATVRLDGLPLAGFVAGPAGELEWAVSPLPPVPAGEGLVLRLEADGPFGAWLLGQGGYKAHGLVAARGVPEAPPRVYRLLRGAAPGALSPLVDLTERSWRELEPAGPLWFYRVEGGEDLRASRCGSSACLDWSGPAGG